MPESYIIKIKESSDFLIKNLLKEKQIKNAMIIGFQFKDIFQPMEISEKIKFKTIPNFPFKSQNPGNFFIINNTLIIDTFLYSYNGYSLKEASYIIRILQNLNIENIFYFDEAIVLDNKNQIQIIEDQINLFGDNPLIGRNYDELGLRFPDMSYPYSRNLNLKIEDICKNKKIAYNKTITIGIKGPTYPTNAEKVFYKKIGANSVVFSILGEVIIASHAGLNNSAVLCPNKASEKVKNKFTQIIQNIIKF